MNWILPGSVLALAGVVVLGTTLSSSGQDVESSSKKPYVSTGYEAVLSGSISFTGETPRSFAVDMSADPACSEVNPKLRTEYVVVANGKLANVFVYAEKSTVLDSYTFEQPTSTVSLEHSGCRFLPHLLGMRVGQTLTIFNKDPTQHNNHPTPRKNPEWNYTQPAGAEPLVKTFKQPETFIPFKCNQHPWEKAYLGVFSHPFFAVSDENGNFRIAGLPPGEYTFVAWHERLGEKIVTFAFVPGDQRDWSFAFKAGDSEYRKQEQSPHVLTIPLPRR